MPHAAALETLPLPPSAPHAPRRRLRFGEVPITETGPFPPPAAPHCWVYVTLNAEIALANSAALRALVHAPRARVSIDGQWLWWALRRKYPGEPLEKLSGSDLIHRLAAHAAAHGERLLLLGSTPAMNAGAVLQLRRRWPGLELAGFAPPRQPDTLLGQAALRRDAMMAIEAHRPDYVVMGFGAAKEHALASQLAPMLDGRVRGLLCFGGAIDLASGRVRRAPAVLQRSGLEGLYRVWQQPARGLRLLRVLRVLPLLARGAY